MASDYFLSLPRMKQFPDVFDKTFFRPVPQDWWVVMTDVVGSTKAIEEGRYKDVNSAGSLSAMAIANIIGHMSFPFIFGGDGMTCLIPDEISPRVRSVLLGLVPLVKNIFDLDLRVGMIPVKDLTEQGATLQCGCLPVSEQFMQAVIDGDGIDIADKLLKNSTTYTVTPGQTELEEPNLVGYSCRWQDFPTHKDETIALIVKFRTRQPEYFRKFFEAIEKLVGQPEEHHPLTLKSTKIRWSAKDLANEVGVHSKQKNGFFAFWRRQLIRFQTIGIHIIIALRLPIKWGKKDLKNVRKDNIRSSDYRKYDNALKMVIAVTTKVRERLEILLQTEKEKGLIYYGVHLSNRAMLTCLMKTEVGQEVHFVDAADGGYAYAAKMLKKQIASESSL